MNAVPLSIQQMHDAISSASASGFEFLVPILAAALDGTIQLTILPRGAAWPTSVLRQQQLPSLVLVGDDDHCPSGPNGWPQELRTYARRAMIHAAAGSLSTYRLALTNCVTARHYVLVETVSTRLDAWVGFFRNTPSPVSLDVIRAVDGQHPLPIERGQMQ